MTTKILALTDALGNLVRFNLLPGQRFDTGDSAYGPASGKRYVARCIADCAVTGGGV